MHGRDLAQLKMHLDVNPGEVPGLPPDRDASENVVFKGLRAKVPADVLQLLYFM